MGSWNIHKESKPSEHGRVRREMLCWKYRKLLSLAGVNLDRSSVSKTLWTELSVTFWEGNCLPFVDCSVSMLQPLPSPPSPPQKKRIGSKENNFFCKKFISCRDVPTFGFFIYQHLVISCCKMMPCRGGWPTREDINVQAYIYSTTLIYIFHYSQHIQ